MQLLRHRRQHGGRDVAADARALRLAVDGGFAGVLADIDAAAVSMRARGRDELTVIGFRRWDRSGIGSVCVGSADIGARAQ